MRTNTFDSRITLFIPKNPFVAPAIYTWLAKFTEEDGLTMEEVDTMAFSAKVALSLATRSRQTEEDLLEHVRMHPSAVTDALKSVVGETVVDLSYFVRDDGEDWTATVSDTGVSLRYANPDYDGFKHYDWDETPHHLLAQILKDPSVTELFNF